MPAGSVKLLPPDAATGAENWQLVATSEGLALINPDGYWSTKGMVKVAEAS